MSQEIVVTRTARDRWLPTWTVLRRELRRFWNIKRQTIGAPVLETYLYISIFGASLGSRIKDVEGHPYVVFIIPGLIMMTLAMNSFSNNAASLMQQKLQRAIDDQLASPVSNVGMLAAFTLGGLIRALIIAGIVFVTASLLVPLPVVHPLMLVATLLLVGVFFASAGVLVGLRSETFDNMSFYSQFVLQPLIFLGGVFYAATFVPEPFKTLTHLDPIYYMIQTVRYGFLGHSDVSVAWSLAILAAVNVAVVALNVTLFRRGYKLRA